jgi:orotidine-5'-phosphate decarboxylase
VGGFKIGLQLLFGPGPATVALIADLGRPVLVDAKLHDIPTTVRRAAQNLGASGARWVTAHASGGRAMLEAAAEGLATGAGGRRIGLLAVTVLTSLTDRDLISVGVQANAAAQTARLARLAAEAGCEGLVLSPRELAVAREIAPSLLRATPGIRPAGSEPDDQARLTSPSEAIRHGAHLLVVGRPVTRSADPVEAARAIVAEARAEPTPTTS